MSTSSPPPEVPTEFRPRTGGFAEFLGPFLGPLGLFLVVVGLLGAVVTQSVGGGLAIGAAATAVLVAVLRAKYRALLANTLVRFSPTGVELVDGRGFQISMVWPDITRIDLVESRMASPRLLGWGTTARARAGAAQFDGLVGWGQRVLPAQAPGWMRTQVSDAPRHPEDGRAEVAIPLGAIDPGWSVGPMGSWVRHYRPDLMPGFVIDP